MDNDSIEARLDFVEGEVIAASANTQRLDFAREAIELLHGIVSDIVKDLPNADEYADDLDRIDQLRALMI